MDVFSRDFEGCKAKIIQRALEAFKDDLGDGDMTTAAVFKENPVVRAVVIAEGGSILAGVLEARAILENGGITVTGRSDGEAVKEGQKVLKLEGQLSEILARERVSLNYLARMSGIATLSKGLCDEYGPRVMFLRKTDPGLLLSEKRAVALGGCLPHRLNLSDGILIKDNHIDQLAKKLGRKKAIRLALSRADDYRGDADLLIEVEVETPQEAEVAARELKEMRGPKAILFDNMSAADVKKAARAVKQTDKKIIIEASGGIDESNIADYLRAGADYVSTSMFLSARPCGFKLEMQ